MIIVSACLAGENCKYNGGNNYHPDVAKLVEQGRAIPMCPEILGGLPTPRPACEITGGDGRDALASRAKVLNKLGIDVTSNFILGAEKVLHKAIECGTLIAILKERSPSCGVNFIYDGTFQSIRVPGQGILAALLTQHNIKLYSEEDFPENLINF